MTHCCITVLLVILLPVVLADTQPDESPDAKSPYYQQAPHQRPYPLPPPPAPQYAPPGPVPPPAGYQYPAPSPPPPAPAPQPPSQYLPPDTQPPTQYLPPVTQPSSQYLPPDSQQPVRQETLQPPAMQMSVIDTVVKCQSRNMRVEFSMSAPFWGIIYPYNNFHKCLLHEGKGETHISLLMGHGTCANEEGLSADGTLAPIIEHRLMIQWDREIVEEWDSSIIVRCDRPDDYNKTIRFDLGTLDQASEIEVATHPGPQMWMEIQKGEGPNAPELQGSVFLGQVLTLVFTLADQYFDFDTNVLTCWALDGENDKRQIEWLNPQGTPPQSSLGHRRFSGELEVISRGCSTKPKIFGHFHKVNNNYDGKRAMTQFAFFKAFRFPTSSKVVIQCNVQVCFRKCEAMAPCSESFHPRASLGAEGASRRRREAGEPADERVNLVKTIEVRLPEEAADLPAGEPPLTATTARVRYQQEERRCEECTSLTTFFIILVTLAALLTVLLSALLWFYTKRQHQASMSTPTK